MNIFYQYDGQFIIANKNYYFNFQYQNPSTQTGMANWEWHYFSLVISFVDDREKPVYIRKKNSLQKQIDLKNKIVNVK